MSNLQNAVESLLRLNTTILQPLNEVCLALQEFGSVEQAVGERKAQLADLNAKIEEARGAATALADEAAAKRAELDGQIAAATAHAETVRVDAKAEADKIIGAANSAAQAIKDEAETWTVNVVANHDRTMAANRAELADLSGKIDAAKAELGGLLSQHADVQTKIAALQVAARQILTNEATPSVHVA